MLPRATIEAFDGWLVSHELQLEAIVVGGSALALLGLSERPTRDVDIIEPELPKDVINAARLFAGHLRAQGVELGDDWLNNGPIQLAEVLPDGWRVRVTPVFSGVAIRLFALGRSDLLKTKLFALCDRGTDLSDCIALAPSVEEIIEATPWLALRDTHPGWTHHVQGTLRDLGRRLGHGIS